MNRYTLPIAFAAALHGALLFGFTKAPRSPVNIPERDLIFITPLPKPDDEPVVASAADANNKRSAELPDAPPPTLPELPVVATATDFNVPVPPPRPDTSNVAAEIIPKAFITRGDGDGRSPWGGNVIPSGALDRTPSTRFQPAPQYPFDAKRSGLRGEVVVEFIVDESGRVLDPRVVSSTDRIFEAPSVNAVSRWIFEPGRRDGRVVRFRMAVPVQFNLND